MTSGAMKEMPARTEIPGSTSVPWVRTMPMTTFVRFLPRTEIFDVTREALLGTDVHGCIGRLREALRHLRAHLPADEWKTVCEEARQHSLHDLLLESPFTRRAYSKPRGYAGDAVLMDLIYGAPPSE